MSHVQTAVQAPGTPTRGENIGELTETFGTTPLVGNLVLVTIAMVDAVVTVVDNQSPHNTFTEVIAVQQPLGFRSRLWAARITTAVGTFSVTVTSNAGDDVMVVGLSEFDGGLSEVPVQTVSAIGSDSADHSPGALSAGAALLFMVDSDTGNAAHAAPAGWSLAIASDDTPNQMCASAYYLGGAAQTPVMTGGFADWGAVGAAFAVAARPADMVRRTPTARPFPFKPGSPRGRGRY